MTRHTLHAATLLPAAAVLACAMPLLAQSDPTYPAYPTAFDDPAISDRGPHAVSQRYIDPGNGQFSPYVTVRRIERQPSHPAAMRATWARVGLPSLDVRGEPAAYEYRAPGVRALMDRPDYVVQAGPRSLSAIATPRRDGAYAPLAPANLVYSLMPVEDRPRPSPSAHADPWQDFASAGPAPHDARRDARLDGRLSPLEASTVLPADFTPDQTP